MASINGNVATIYGGTISSSAKGQQMTITSGSSLSQTVTITDSKTTKVYTGSGEKTLISRVDLTQVDTSNNWTITLQYSPSGSNTLSPSSLQIGGPYVIGRLHLLIVVAENGDDTDYNDCVCQMTWT